MGKIKQLTYERPTEFLMHFMCCMCIGIIHTCTMCCMCCVYFGFDSWRPCRAPFIVNEHAQQTKIEGSHIKRTILLSTIKLQIIIIISIIFLFTFKCIIYSYLRQCLACFLFAEGRACTLTQLLCKCFLLYGKMPILSCDIYPS